MDCKVLEIVTFKSKSEYDVNDVIRYAKEMEDDLINSIPGYISRKLVYKGTNNWLDIVEWSSMEEALSATEIALTLSKSVQFFECIETGTTKMEHYPIYYSS